MTSTKAIFCGIMLTFIVARLTPALADACGDFRAQEGTVQDDLVKQQVENKRFNRLQPTPHIDAPLCIATRKLMLDLERLDELESSSCFPSQESFNSFEDSHSNIYQGALAVYASAHCRSLFGNP